MELYTRIPWAKPRFQFDYADRITLMGSCFAESIGSLLTENKFTTDVNPFGILYNPASVAEGTVVEKVPFSSRLDIMVPSLVAPAVTNSWALPL